MKIHKFNIPDVPSTKIIRGRLAGVFSLGLDGSGWPAIYVGERDTGEITEVEIEVVWTGGEIPVDKEFLGTVLTEGDLVLHVFYKPIIPNVVNLDSLISTDLAREWLSTGHG